MWKPTFSALKPASIRHSIVPLTLTLACLTLGAADVPSSKSTHGPYLLVANQGDRSLSIIDPATDKQIAAVPVGGVTGHEVAASPDGRIAYVPIYGNSGVAKPGTDGTSMSVIDLASQKVIGTVDFGHGVRPHCPIYDPVSKLLYVTTEIDKSITIIDPKTLKIVGSIPTGEEYSHMLAISHDGQRGYTANVKPGTVSVLDMKARKTITVIPISPFTQRISISKDDRMVFTSDQTKPQLAVIDTATNAVKTWVPLRCARIRNRFDLGRPLAARHYASGQPGRGRRPDHTQGSEDHRCAQRAAGSPDAPRWSCRLCLLQREKSGRGHRPLELDGKNAHRRGQDGRRAGLGEIAPPGC